MSATRGWRPPAVAIKPETLVSEHGSRTDDYAWLRDDSRRQRAVLAQLRREEQATEAWFAPLRSQMKALHEELRSRVVDQDQSVPLRRGDFEYYWRELPGKDHPLYLRRHWRSDGAEERLLDAQRRAAGSEAYTLGELLPSPDGRYLAVTEDRSGDGVYTLAIKDLRRQRWLAERIDSVDAGVVWAADSRQLLYVHKDPGTLAALEVRIHRLGEAADADRQIYREADSAYYLSVGSAHSERTLIIHAEATRRTKVLLIPADDPLRTPRPVGAEGDRARLYYDDDGRDAWLLSDHQAPNFQLLRTPLAEIGAGRWETAVAHDEAVVIEDFLPLPEALVLVERRNCQLGLRIIDRASGEQRLLFHDDGISALTLGDNPEPDPRQLQVRRDYWQQPGELLALDLADDSMHLLKRDAVAVAVDGSDYRVDRLEVTSGSVRVPVTILRHRDTPTDGSAPLWLYGYGAYGESLDPEFDPDRLSLLDRGVVMAYAHVRGGGERGAQWHDQGRAGNKANSFVDFVAVADHLAAAGYAAPERMVAVGGSAGGLLVAAALNLRPERFRAALLQVPFVDVLSTMLDPQLPLTTLEYEEWGDPRSADDYQAISAWSPYDNLRPANYPAVLATAGLYDGQVSYWEPAKYVARLRRLSNSGQPVMLKVDFGAGHQGVSGRYSALGEVAISYSFALKQLGVW